MSKCVVVIDVAIVCFECSPNYLVPIMDYFHCGELNNSENVGYINTPSPSPPASNLLSINPEFWGRGGQQKQRLITTPPISFFKRQKQSASLCLISSSVPRRFDQGCSRRSYKCYFLTWRGCCRCILNKKRGKQLAFFTIVMARTT